ncbi:hypothetical protein L5515_015541 [Caenorhabditis briggsae]|uniref:Uncharacterized protein n=1 Tax=Caenorhabditis briggsae TaxID=6238 RepID=A0AAE9J8W4_CAEBR|nr:hypothetical protein L5515_015541 [Caenorhabditis briggsae]
MPVVLYPVLRSILEHMEANCRFSLSGRCPEISRVEKSVPLRVKTILFSDNTFSINNIKYKVFFEIPRMRIMYTLLPIRMPNHPLTMRIYHFNTKVFAEKKFSRNYGIEEALRKVMEYFFGGRSNIHDQCVTVFDNGTCEEVKVTNTKTFFDINAVSIQIDSESKIVVYGGKTYYWSEVVSKVVIKAMAVGSSAEIQKEETEPLEEPKIVPRKPFNYFAIVIPLLTLLIAYFFWLHLFLEHIHHLTPSD